MRKAVRKDRKTVVDILQHSFRLNPTLKYMTKTANKESQIAKVASFAFDIAIRRGGVFLSENEMGTAICYDYYTHKNDLIDFLHRLKLCVTAVPIHKWVKMLRHNKYITRSKPAHDNFLYFWFFGVMPEEKPRTSARDLLTTIFQMALDQKKDIYAETTVLQNKVVYQRFGFEVYKKWVNEECGLTVWFLRKKYSSNAQYLSGLDYG